MKFLKARAAASRVLEGMESELTMLRRLREYWGLVASCLRAVSAVGDCLLAFEIAGQRRGGTGNGEVTFAVLRRIEGCIKQLGDVTNVGRHDER
jgi:hypothetical protein